MRLYLACLLLLTQTATASDWQCASGGTVELDAGKDDDDRAEASGVVVDPDEERLYIVSNEALKHDGRWYAIQEFRRERENRYRITRDLELFEAGKENCPQSDFEALTRNGDDFFAVTSHSVDRAKQRKNESPKENEHRLTRANIRTCDTRSQLIKFTIGSGDRVEIKQRTSLRDFIDANAVLSPFVGLPNKENGVDIEGLAATDDALFVGFRGPVLRENFVPVLRLSKDLDRENVMNAKVLFVTLDGRGIRDLAPADNGLYVLAGPNGDEEQSFRIYAWNTRTQVAGNGEEAGSAERLCDLGYHPKNKLLSKPEGLTLLSRNGDELRFLVVFDGKKRPTAEIWDVRRTDK
ncbi:DUF3616 domain-containing protein [Hyphomicrobium sp. xq]|uniref:DUF3616 domain-containing protein n=1 Tax=Hyphomicrobium album TaxID=2665159 RepID=A0A6I3KD43_9HYPH|nr:DUF3616 domain-containing protein [Hyphomicrobium album]MTD92734.1 DUF3616 domain-containing protein [Hyphomicrobium album]